MMERGQMKKIVLVSDIDASSSNYIDRNINPWIYLVANRDYTNSDLLSISIHRGTMDLDGCYYHLDRNCHYNHALLALVMIEAKKLVFNNNISPLAV
jgi:hypothetical protein